MTRRLNDNISKETKKIIYKNKGHLRNKRTKRRTPYYTKEVFRSSGFNFLEYYGAIRRFLISKYDLNDNDTLELLYYLYPRAYFTLNDYKNYPMRWGRERWYILKRKGLFEQVFPEQERRVVYRLSREAKDIVVLAHKLLTGEKIMPVWRLGNKAMLGTATPAQKRYRKLMREAKEAMQSQDRQEQNKPLFAETMHNQNKERWYGSGADEDSE
jgi:hypothetical protein